MQIEFPCPERIENMTPNSNGAFCHSCNKPLTDVSSYSQTEKEEFSKTNPTACVIDSNDTEDENSTNWFSTRKFALALLIAGSTTLFSFAEPMMGTELDNLREALITEPTNNSIPLYIIIKNQHGSHIDGDVSVELPNGKILIPEFVSKIASYRVYLPAYCQDKAVTVIITRGKKTQNKKVVIESENKNEVTAQFRTKKHTQILHRKISIGSF